MPEKQPPTPAPSVAEIRLAVEKVFPAQTEKLSPEDGIRRMQDRIVELKQNVAAWNHILNTDSANEIAQKCIAADQTDLRSAETRLQEYQLQAGSQN